MELAVDSVQNQTGQKHTDDRTQLLMHSNQQGDLQRQQLAGGFTEGLSGQFSCSLTKIWNYRENTALSVPVKDFPQKTLQEWELAPLHGLEFQTV